MGEDVIERGAMVQSQQAAEFRSFGYVSLASAEARHILGAPELRPRQPIS